MSDDARTTGDDATPDARWTGDDATRDGRQTTLAEPHAASEPAGPRVGRRAVLASAATLAVVTVAGCTGRSMADAGKRPLSENPVGKRLDDQPRLGQPRSETEIALVTFDDPHCSYCKQFHEGAFQRIRTEWVDAGRATAYVRAHSVTGGWGPAALHALEEARRRDERLYWRLKERYFEHQDDLTGDGIVARTRSFVAEADVAVDADAVARAAAEKPHGEAIAADERAAEKALQGDGDATPTTFVFEGGEFRTTLGAEDFSAFEAAIESDG